jgi:hypothetical protein
MMDDDECEAACGIIDKGNQSTRRKTAKCYFVHHKSHKM